MPKLKKCLNDELKDVLNIAITFDSWTNCNHSSFVAITGRFLSSKMPTELRSALIILIHTDDMTHTAKNLADLMLNECLKDIKDKIVCAVTDDGRNMVNAVDKLGIKHLGCFAQTLQLVINSAIVESKSVNAKTLENRKNVSLEPQPITKGNKQNISSTLQLFSEKEEEAILAELEAETLPENADSDSSAYLLIMKCKLIVKFFNSSCKSLALLRKQLKKVDTRWNSTFFMIKRINEVIDHIHSVKPKIPSQNPFPSLKPDEMEALPDIIKILSAFEEATTLLSGSSYPSISMVIPTIKGIFLSLDAFEETSSIKSKIGKYFLVCLKNSCNRLLVYEKRTATRFATILDARFKEDGFISLSQYRDSMESLKTEIRQQYGKHLSDNSQNTSPSIESTTTKNVPKFFNFLQKPKKSVEMELGGKPLMSDVIKQINSFTEAPKKEFEVDPIKFWYKQPESVLKKIALKYLIIPATSVPSECVFSVAGYTQSARRSRLLPQNLEKIIFLNKNLNLLDENF